MPDSKNPNDKQHGEKPEGKYHYNPGNQSGKTAEIVPKEEKEETKENEPRLSPLSSTFILPNRA